MKIFFKEISLMFTLLLMISGCVKTLSGETGILDGTITIGPICPVQTDPPSPHCLPTAETYKAYPVDIWNADQTHKILHISPALNGSFSVSLVPGQYVIMLDRANSIGGSNLPMKVTVTGTEITTVAIDIDTGIR